MENKDLLKPESVTMGTEEYVNIANMQARKDYLSTMVNDQKAQTKKLQKVFLASEQELEDIVDEKVMTINDKEELERRMRTDLDWFFTNDATGDRVKMMQMPNSEKEIEFKKDYIRYVWVTGHAMLDIDKEQEKLDAAINDFNVSNDTLWNELSGNVLPWVRGVKERTSKDHPNYALIMQSCKYIESAYTLEILNECLDKYPTVIKNTLYDMKTERRIKETGSRYVKKLAQNHVNASLFQFLSEKDEDSLEATCLRPGQWEKGQENLLIFSCIRFFSMEDWGRDSVLNKFHASLIVMLKKLVTNTLQEEEKEEVLTNIANYLARFK